MPTRKIDNVNELQFYNNCTHPDHHPPTHQVFESGTYEHECPVCHEKQIFHIFKPTY